MKIAAATFVNNNKHEITIHTKNNEEYNQQNKQYRQQHLAVVFRVLQSKERSQLRAERSAYATCPYAALTPDIGNTTGPHIAIVFRARETHFRLDPTMFTICDRFSREKREKYFKIARRGYLCSTCRVASPHPFSSNLKLLSDLIILPRFG